MKNYLLLASSKGIGFGIAKHLFLKNHNVFIGSRNQENVNQAINELKKIYRDSGNQNIPQIDGSVVDVHSYESIEYWFNKGISQFNNIHGLLINYGGPPVKNFLDINDHLWKESFEFMLLNPIRLLKMAHPYFVKDDSSVLVVTSYVVKEPIEHFALSNVFRSGMTALIKTLAREWAPHIRLNCIMPGRIDTDRIRQIDAQIANSENKDITEIKKYFENQIPLKRYGTIDEIGRIGAFLLSNESHYLTGSSIAVDGGMIHTLI